jgi:hypothetical protein
MADPLKALLDAGAIRSTPFPPSSRYANVIIAQVAAADGTLRVCLRRRFVPAPERFATLGEHVVSQGDRLDQIAARAFGDPELWWRLADANGALRPDELVREAGTRLRITAQEDLPGPAKE